MHLKLLRSGAIVILDNLQSHKGKAVRDATGGADARLLLLPPFSPDLNPIKQVFAKLKHLLREAAKRTAEATWRGIGDILSQFSPNDAANTSSTQAMRCPKVIML